MAFRDFSFPQVNADLGLFYVEARLFTEPPPPLVLDQGYLDRLAEGAALAIAINTEKARSEFIIAPILGEVRRHLGGRFGLFSGVEFNVDAGRGLNGYCDFLLTRSPLQYVLTAPVVAVAEAKNDNIRNGFGQCVAGMVAAREFNERAGTPAPAIYGVATTGTSWQFFRLRGSDLTLDRTEYPVHQAPLIAGVLVHILESTVT